MGVKVHMAQGTNRADAEYPESDEWYAAEDGTLQIYQKVHGAKTTVAEYARGHWHSAFLHPTPEADTDNEEENSSK
jgi:hypothetical protein